MILTQTQAAETRKIVLIVEDEVLIRLAVADYIRDAGYQVVEASNADEALEYLQGPNNVSLVFSDVRMPGTMDGLKLAQRIRESYPALSVILASGHLLPEEAGGVPFLSKPYNLAEVLAKIRGLFDDSYEDVGHRVDE